ncbi:MAG: bifunctional phosphopantothenoylcysteine decarboxylase/phosphopantothenate--cysteine ligase CoaBC [Alkalibacterium sp.]|nr:bifunctional phosphopantothenoylcysteine decarboxylase/phosphopantothenate--cysteine ligase CoaBC [Alkalibacterium sp.]
MFKGKKIALYVTGGIAVYKVVDLMRELIKNGAEVRVAMTPSACEFVSPLTFQVLSRHFIYLNTFEENDPEVVNHINIADWSDLALVAPASANTIAKLSAGLADNFVTSALLATTAPVFIVPAMNANMYKNTVTQENIEKLKNRGHYVMTPDKGFLAEGYEGEGRFPEKTRILDELKQAMRDQDMRLPLKGKTIIITAGGTKERIDPVRFISNDSSGKMGHALAEAAWRQGATVKLITTSQLETPGYIERLAVESAAEMYNEVHTLFKEADALVMAAAVSDYSPKNVEKKKMKKQNELTLELKKNPDILMEMGRIKAPQQCLIGFAAETDNIIEYAKEKLTAKHADLIVANDVGKTDRGFNVDSNEVTLVSHTDEPKVISLQEKSKIAGEIINWLIEYYN